MSAPEVSQQAIGPAGATVRVRGELDLATVAELEAMIERALGQGSAPLLIDLARCGFIDSSVISLLADVGVRLGNSGRPRFAVIATEQPLHVLRLTGMDSHMPVFTSLPEALKTFEVAGAADA